MTIQAPALPRWSGWQTAGLLALGLVILAAYASIGRPLWFDEFVHFALGGLEPSQALVSIVATTGSGLNQGHTGVYLFVDYWLMQAFGANLLALRLPSLVSGAILLASAVTFMRLKGFSPAWGGLAMVTLAANASLMHYAGEARPYMPLAASCLATLTYYQFPLSLRHSVLARGFGVVGILGGAVSHPYYALFGLAIGVYSLWERGHLVLSRRSRSEVVHFLNPAFVLPAIFLYVVLGLLTWAKGRPGDPNDPWLMLGGLENAVNAFVAAHLEPFEPVATPTAVALIVLVAAIAYLTRVASPRVVLPPLVLIATGVLTSLAVTLLSVIGDYWVFTRQWIGGLAIVSLGAVWLLAAAWTSTTSRSRSARVLILALGLLIGVSGTLRVGAAIPRTVDHLAAWSEYSTPTPAFNFESIISNTAWVEPANWNVAKGGPVWPGISEFYGRWTNNW